MIELTSEYTKSAMARAVPGSAWDADRKAWVLLEPTPRAAVVALKLFPGLEHDYPELLELRDSLMRDVSPVDYANQLGLEINPRRVLEAMGSRGWSLHDYQRTDLGYAEAILREHGGFYLGWARGKGKTLGTCCLIDVLDARRTLIVAPNTAKTSVWADELRVLCPWLRVHVLPNNKHKREIALHNVRLQAAVREPLVLIAHYEALAIIAGKSKTKNGRTSLGDGWKKLGIEWDLIALDEGHRIANPQALQTKAAKKIPAKHRLILSGSVMQNSWEELFGPLSFLFPDRYRSRWRDWNDRFLDYVDNGYGKTCVGVKPGMEQALREELGVFMVLRDKESLTTNEVVKVQLSPAQRKAYDELVATCLAELEDGTRVKAQVGVAMLTRLRQVATGLDTLSAEVRDSTKLEAAVATIKAGLPRGDDFVVFCWYKSSAYALAARLLEHDIESWVITGDADHAHRAEWIKQFQAGKGRVLIGTIPTMGESVNLQRANHVVRIDRSFNPALNLQAVDRVDRQGQTREVYLTDIVAEGTVDELVVMPSLANKEALRAAILGGNQ